MKYLLVSILFLVLIGTVFQQFLDNYKFKKEIYHLNRLVTALDNTSKMRRQLLVDIDTKYSRMKSKYNHMREQNYLLTRKFRKTDTKAYKKYLSKLMRDAHGIGGAELVDKKK